MGTEASADDDCVPAELYAVSQKNVRCVEEGVKYKVTTGRNRPLSGSVPQIATPYSGDSDIVRRVCLGLVNTALSYFASRREAPPETVNG